MVKGSAVAQWYSACLIIEGLHVRASQASVHCVLEQDTLILALYWFNPGRPVPYRTERLLIGRLESNQSKQTNSPLF